MVNNENIKHIKEVLLKYLKGVPFTEDNNELLLTVIFSMLHLSDSETKEIRETRKKLTPAKTPVKKKRGIF